MKEQLSLYGKLEENVSLKKYNTYRIETTTRYLIHPDTGQQLIELLNYLKKENIPFFILGNGSNVILSDTEYPGVVIKLDHFNKIEYQNNLVTVGAGVMINKLAFDILDHGLKGLEWASGIPGTIGGSVFGNAEAYKVPTFEYLKSVTFITPDREIKTKVKDQISYGYRTSYFKENPDNIIIEATFEFPNGNKEDSLELIEDRKKRRVSTQPLNYPSAGSVFRNPSPEMPCGKLIEDLGLKGTKIGDAIISDLHANFILNIGHATGKNILDLIQLIQNKVKEKYKIDLILEQEHKSW